MTTSSVDKDSQHKPPTSDGQGASTPTIFESSENPSDNNVEIFSKPNPTILARYNDLSRQERLYSNLLFANAATGSLLKGDRRHSIEIQEFRRLTNYQHKCYTELKRCFDNLLTKKIEFGALDDDMPHFKAMTWIAEYELKDGILYYEYSTTMEEELRNLIRNNPKIGYTKLDLMIQNKLVGKHSLTLYELAKKYAKVKSTGFKDLEWWRDAFSVRPEQYPLFKEFKRRVFQASIAEINQETDIFLSMEEKGRPIQAVKIIIDKNPNYMRQIMEDADFNIIESDDGQLTDQNDLSLEDTIARLQEIYGLDGKCITEFLNSDKYNDKKLFIEAFQHLETKRKAGKIVSALDGYAFVTIRDYKKPKKPIPNNSASKIDIQRKKKQAEVSEKNAILKKKQISLLSQHYDALTETEQEEFKLDYLSHLSELRSKNLGGTYILVMIRLIEDNGVFADISDSALNYLIPHYTNVYPNALKQEDSLSG